MEKKGRGKEKNRPTRWHRAGLLVDSCKDWWFGLQGLGALEIRRSGAIIAPGLHSFSPLTDESLGRGALCAFPAVVFGEIGTGC